MATTVVGESIGVAVVDESPVLLSQLAGSLLRLVPFGLPEFVDGGECGPVVVVPADLGGIEGGRMPGAEAKAKIAVTTASMRTRSPGLSGSVVVMLTTPLP